MAFWANNATEQRKSVTKMGQLVTIIIFALAKPTTRHSMDHVFLLVCYCIDSSHSIQANPVLVISY